MNREAVLQKARTGCQQVQVDDSFRDAALQNLERWLTEPQFDRELPQLEYLVEEGKFETLFDAFFRDIPFGTGGRRGPVGYGTNRINHFTLSTSIQGHCDFLKKRFPAGGICTNTLRPIQNATVASAISTPGTPNAHAGPNSSSRMGVNSVETIAPRLMEK